MKRLWLDLNKKHDCENLDNIEPPPPPFSQHLGLFLSLYPDNEFVLQQKNQSLVTLLTTFVRQQLLWGNIYCWLMYTYLERDL